MSAARHAAVGILSGIPQELRPAYTQPRVQPCNLEEISAVRELTTPPTDEKSGEKGAHLV